MTLKYSDEHEVLMFDTIRRTQRWHDDRKVPTPAIRPKFVVTAIKRTNRILEVTPCDMKGEYHQVDPIDFELVSRGVM